MTNVLGVIKEISLFGFVIRTVFITFIFFAHIKMKIEIENVRFKS